MSNWRALLALAIVLLGSGCSVKFAYNNLDRFARWGISDYVAMNDEQRRYFDAEFAKWHDWHRANHLPKYADMLEALPPMLADGVDHAEIIAVENTMVAWGEELMARGMPMVIELMHSLTDEQMARLPRLLEAGNDEIARPEMGRSLDASQMGWRDDVTDIFSRFAGRLSDEQRSYLISQSVRYLPERELWADYRRRWQADLLLLLAERHDAARLAERFGSLVADRKTYYGAELTQIFARNEALGREVAGWLLNNMTERQQARLFERLLDLAVELRELAAEAGGSRGDGCRLSC